MNQVPTQTVTVEPDERLIEHAENRYAQTAVDLDREEYIERVVIELLRIDLNTDTDYCNELPVTAGPSPAMTGN